MAFLFRNLWIGWEKISTSSLACLVNAFLFFQIEQLLYKVQFNYVTPWHFLSPVIGDAVQCGYLAGYLIGQN